MYDPAIDLSEDPDTGKLASNIAEFMQSRDLEHLKFTAEPSWFYLRPISRKAMLAFVMKGETDHDRFARAFMVSLDRVENFVGDDGETLAVYTPSRPQSRDGSVDAIDAEAIEMFSITDILEIGAVAFQRSFLPLGCGACYQAPQSSVSAWGMRAVVAHSQRVEQKTVELDPSDEPEEQPTPTPAGAFA